MQYSVEQFILNTLKHASLLDFLAFHTYSSNNKKFSKSKEKFKTLGRDSQIRFALILASTEYADVQEAINQCIG